MEWFNSVPTSGTTDTLTHSFACPKCGATKDISARQEHRGSIATDPAHWHSRAAETRKKADGYDPDTKKRLFKLADEYDKLAEWVLNRQRDL
jgi:DNA-directed RNA polymerase subunit M/transcription elongation factor TFIIS